MGNTDINLILKKLTYANPIIKKRINDGHLLTYSFPSNIKNLTDEKEYWHLPFKKITKEQRYFWEKACAQISDVIPFTFKYGGHSKVKNNSNNIPVANIDFSSVAGAGQALTTFEAFDKYGKEIKDEDKLDQAIKTDNFSKLNTFIIVNHQASHVNILQKPNQKGMMHFFLLHELMHVMGTVHGHDFGLTQKHTITSYDAHPNYDLVVRSLITPKALLLYDVLWLQQKYGQNLKTRRGNTYYKQNNDEMSELNCLWDAGGQDTLDVSESSRGCLVDLRDMQFSSLGNHRFKFKDAVDNFSIAAGVALENTITNDKTNIVYGNQYNNIFNNGNGNDFTSITDRTIKTTVQKGKKVKQEIVYGWGHDILYSSGGYESVIINVTHPENLSFEVKNKSLIVKYARHKSSLTVANFNSKKTLIFVGETSYSSLARLRKKYSNNYRKGLRLEKKYEAIVSEQTELKIKKHDEAYQDKLNKVSNDYSVAPTQYIPFAF